MNHTALTTPAGTPNLVNPTREPCPFTITFPSVEVALAELGQKVFGATIVIAERPAPPPTPSVEAEYQRLGLADMDHAIIKAQLERDEAATEVTTLRDEAATEVTTLRDEVKRLADMLDKCRSGNLTRDALNKALKEKLDNWMKTAELRLGTVCCLQEEKENLVAERDTLAKWKREALTVISKWDEVDDYVRKHPEPTIGDFISEIVLKWLKERDALKAQNCPAPAPSYRLLDVGEVLLNTDEFNYANGGWDASQEAGYKVSPSSVGRYRRKITTA